MSDIRLCPVCGSGKVQELELSADSLQDGTNARCVSCMWHGKLTETVSKPMELGQAEDIAAAVAAEYLRSLAVYAGVHIGRAMVAVGLVTTSEKQSLTRLIKAAVMGAHKATLDEIEKIQQEIKNGDAS